MARSRAKSRRFIHPSSRRFYARSGGRGLRSAAGASRPVSPSAIARSRQPMARYIRTQNSTIRDRRAPERQAVTPHPARIAVDELDMDPVDEQRASPQCRERIARRAETALPRGVGDPRGAALQRCDDSLARVDHRQRDHQDADADREPRRRAGPERRLGVDRRPRRGVEPERDQRRRRRAEDACSRRRPSSRAAAISAPTAPPANTNPAHGNSVNDGELADRAHVPLQPQRQRDRPACAARTIGVDHRERRGERRGQTRSARRRAAASAPHQPAATIAGPMMLRMSTRNSVTGVAAGVTMNAWRRNRNARMKISRPRRHDRRRPRRGGCRSARRSRVAASTTASPASHRNSGAANPPRTVASRNAIVRRSAG